MKNIKISLLILLSSIFSLNLSAVPEGAFTTLMAVSYTHLRAHET